MEKPTLSRKHAMPESAKKIVIPIDGSRNALKSLDYIELIYGPGHNLDVNLLYVLPSLPQILTEGITMDKKLRLKRTNVEKKNVLIAERILAEAKNILLKKGFEKKRIRTTFQKVQMSIAKDISNWAYREKVDAVALTRRGRTDLDTFFMGAVSSKLVHYSPDCPVWILGNTARYRKVLVCMDCSKNALRAVDHVGFMLSGTDCQATLFHSVRHLRRYVPMEVIEGHEELQKLWKNETGRQIAVHMEKAQKMLLNAGLTKDQIGMKVVDAGRSAADEILKEARNSDCGTIVLGRHGESMGKEFMFGSVTSKILHHSPGLAVWVIQ